MVDLETHRIIDLIPSRDEAEVKQLRSQGMTYPRIHKIISEKGYNGSVASLRMFMQKERIREAEKENIDQVNSEYQPKEFVQRKSLSQLIYKNIESVYTISKEQLKMVLKTYPILADLYALIKEFYEIIYSKIQVNLIHALLKRENIVISEKIVRRFMCEEDLIEKIKKTAKYNSCAGEITPAVPNKLEGDLAVTKPNTKWLTDITEFSIPAGKVYLSQIVDCLDSLLVTWNIGVSPDSTLVNTMLDNAIIQLQPNDILNNYLIWYNESRIKKSLGYMSPMEYRRSLGLAG